MRSFTCFYYYREIQNGTGNAFKVSLFHRESVMLTMIYDEKALVTIVTRLSEISDFGDFVV